MRFAFIGEMEKENAGMPRDARFPVELMCEVLEVSRAGYYAGKNRGASRRASEDEKLTERIVAIDKDNHGRYGIDRIHGELARQGHRHSPKRVRRLARAVGVECVHPKPTSGPRSRTLDGRPVACSTSSTAMSCPRARINSGMAISPIFAR